MRSTGPPGRGCGRRASGCRRSAPACGAGWGRCGSPPGFGLPAGHVIHTVGPVWSGGGDGEPAELAACYRNALAAAAGLGCESVAFPAISCGVYGYPPDRAAAVAVSTCRDHLRSHALPQTVHLVAFGGAVEAALRAAIAAAD